jgi:hypothetical protein
MKLKIIAMLYIGLLALSACYANNSGTNNNEDYYAPNIESAAAVGDLDETNYMDANVAKEESVIDCNIVPDNYLLDYLKDDSYVYGVNNAYMVNEWVKNFSSRKSAIVNILYSKTYWTEQSGNLQYPGYILHLESDGSDNYTASIIVDEKTKYTVRSSIVVKRKYDYLFATDTNVKEWLDVWRFASYSTTQVEIDEYIYENNSILGNIKPAEACAIIKLRVGQYHNFVADETEWRNINGVQNFVSYFPLDIDPNNRAAVAEIIGSTIINGLICYVVEYYPEPGYNGGRFAVDAEQGKLIWRADDRAPGYYFFCDTNPEYICSG